MVKYKQILAVICVIVALGASSVSAEETISLEDRDLLIDKTTVSGEQILPDRAELEAVDEEKKGSIQVELTDGKTGTDKSNIKINCQKIADIVQGEYILTDTFASCDVDLNAIENSNDLKTAAEKLLTESLENAETNTTDKFGKVTFNNLKVGVYLISAEDSVNYDTIEPSLIAIPTWSDSDGNMLYDVIIEPKHTEKADDEKNVAPQTNLEENTWKYVGVACICAIGAVVCKIKVRKRKR